MYIKKNDQKKMILGGIALVAVALIYAYINIPAFKDKANSYLPFGEKTVVTTKTTTTEVDDRPYVEYNGVKYYDEDSIRKAEIEGKIGNGDTAINKLNQKISQYEANKKEEERKATNAKTGVIIQVTGAFDIYEKGAYVRQGFTDFNRDDILRDFITNKAAWQSAEVERISLFGQSLKTGMTAREIYDTWKAAGVQCKFYTISAKDLKDLTKKYNRAAQFDINK